MSKNTIRDNLPYLYSSIAFLIIVVAATKFYVHHSHENELQEKLHPIKLMNTMIAESNQLSFDVESEAALRGYIKPDERPITDFAIFLRSKEISKKHNELNKDGIITPTEFKLLYDLIISSSKH